MGRVVWRPATSQDKSITTQVARRATRCADMSSETSEASLATFAVRRCGGDEERLQGLYRLAS